MGADQQTAKEEGDVVYVKVPISAQEKARAQKSANKPLPGYAYIRDHRPALYPSAKETYERVNQTIHNDPNISGAQKLPVYELATMPGCFYYGEWKKGRPHGMGQIFGKNGIYYKGPIIDGVVTCKQGFFIYPDGSYYVGDFKDNTFHGAGKFHSPYDFTTYTGNWRSDKPYGEATEEYYDNSKYEGDFKEGKKHGQGKYTWANGRIYKGGFSNGHIHGKGNLMMKGNQSSFQGTFDKGNKIEGKLITEYGTYDGKFINGLMHSPNASFKWNDGRSYIGPFEFGELHGEGTITCGGGHMIKGRWERGRNVAILSMDSYKD